MIQPRIFISHSAKEEHARACLDSLYQRLRDAGFEVLLDRKRLDHGSEWRRELHIWLGICDAAIVLFSEDALESGWVKKEATILTWRHALNQSFLVLPILLAPVSHTALASGDFAPLALNEIQALADEAPDVLADRVAARLLPLRDNLQIESPLQNLERNIAIAIGAFDHQSYADVVAQLGQIPEPWSSSDDHARILARQLLQADFASVVSAMRTLAPYLRSRESAQRILEILAPFWTDPQATARIPAITQRPRAKRGFSINSRMAFTGTMYVRRAASHFPSWTIVPVTNVTGFDQAGDLIQQIRQELRKQLEMEDDDDQTLMAFLEHMAASEPFFIMIPGYLDDTVFTAVRQAFPFCTFLVLADDANPEGGAPLTDVELLQPKVDRDREQQAYNLYLQARVIIKNSHVT